MNSGERASESRRKKRRGKRRIRLSLPSLSRKDQNMETSSNTTSVTKRRSPSRGTNPVSTLPHASVIPPERAGENSIATQGFSRWDTLRREVRNQIRKRRLTLSDLEEAKSGNTEGDEEEGEAEIKEIVPDDPITQVDQEENFEDDSLDEGRRRSLYSLPGAFRVSRMIINNTEVEEIHLEDVSIGSSFTTKTPPVLIPKASLVPEQNHGTENDQAVPIAFPQSNVIYFSKRNVFCCIGFSCLVFAGMMTALLMVSWGKPSREGQLSSSPISEPPRIFGQPSDDKTDNPSIGGLPRPVGKPTSKSSSQNEPSSASNQAQESPLTNEDISESFIDASVDGLPVETNSPTDTPSLPNSSFPVPTLNPTQYPSLLPILSISTVAPTGTNSPRPSKSPSKSPSVAPTEFKSPQPSGSTSRSPSRAPTNSQANTDPPESFIVQNAGIVLMPSSINPTIDTEKKEVWSIVPSIAPEEHPKDLWEN